MRAYIYEEIDHATSEYHEHGGLIVITDRDPIDVLPWGVGNLVVKATGEDAYKDNRSGYYATDPWPATAKKPLDRSQVAYVLPEPTRVLVVADDEAEGWFAFANTGCC